MAAVEITITGVLFDKVKRTTQPVVLIGDATLTGLEVGGGPVQPPAGGPPSIWPSPGHPAHPIAPGGPPPYPAHPIAPGGEHPEHPIPPRPAHPIVLPPGKPTDPPTEPPTQPADPAWSWAWNPNTGWIPAYVPGDKPHPVPPPGQPAQT